MFDGTGTPIRDALIEIWQADASGLYNSPAETARSGGPEFHSAGADGRPTWRPASACFETIKPGRVPFRDGRLMAPHISSGSWRAASISACTRGSIFRRRGKGQRRGPDPHTHRATHARADADRRRARATPTCSMSICRARTKRYSSTADRQPRMIVSPFDHPLLSALLGDEEMARLFTLEAELDAMLSFERALARRRPKAASSQAAADSDRHGAGLVPPDTAKLRDRRGEGRRVVPELVRQISEAVGEPHERQGSFRRHQPGRHRHLADARLRPAIDHMDLLLTENIVRLAGLEQRFGGRTTDPAMTRMQPAIPITVIRSHRSLAGAARATPVTPCGTVRPPAGRCNSAARRDPGKVGRQGPRRCAQALAARLGLADAPQWHSQRDGLADFAGLALAGDRQPRQVRPGYRADGASRNGDRALGRRRLVGDAAQAEPGEGRGPGGACPLQCDQLSGMQQALVHEQERSGAAWTLEWLLLPQMVVATAAARCGSPLNWRPDRKPGR